MPVYLGLDVGSNSVGSAWVDTEKRVITAGVSVFPAGVEDSDTKRGAPKNQARRQKRSSRHSIRHRSERKALLRWLLTQAGLLPKEKAALDALFQQDPWALRRDGLRRPLTAHEFGRVLVHLGQRRGALGIEADDEKEAGKVKDAIRRTSDSLADGKTFGEMMALKREEGRQPLLDKNSQPVPEKFFALPIRNRAGVFAFHATRAMIRDEFNRLWNKQREFGGELGKLLTDELRRKLEDDNDDENWRCKGALFGQRRTWWDTGTIGRCDLEPTDHKCPIGDRHAQAFLVLETVNNIRIQERGQPERPLNEEERRKVVAKLREQKSATPATVRAALGLKSKNLKAFYALNIERDPDRKVNTDWFYSQIVHGSFGEKSWAGLDESKRESVNRALLKLDPESPENVNKLRKGAVEWWGMDAQGAEKIINAWKSRFNTSKRVNLSRRAIINLLPYLENGATVTEARQQFAQDPSSKATPEQRARYAFTFNKAVMDAIARQAGRERAEQLLGQRGLNYDARHFLEMHPDTLPLPPMLANPVARQAIYEVRRHVNAYLRRFGRKPDRVVIELAREAYQTARVRDDILKSNRRRDSIRKKIIAEFQLERLSPNQQRAAVERVLLCRQQKGARPYTDTNLIFTEAQAAQGEECEVDHIVPRSKGGDSGLSNLLLVERGANRNKGNRTPKEWLAPAEFQGLLQKLAHIEKSQGDEYFRETDFKRKWDNLNAAVTPDGERRWRESQLTSTAYAARQVAEYLQSALYRDDPPDKRCIFFSNGRYTSMLRRDWQLYETGAIEVGEESGESRAGRVEKDRTDHRNHAVDAAVIALTGPKIVEQAASGYAWQEEHKALTGQWPPRPPISPPAPWTGVEELRAAIMRPIFGSPQGDGGLVVSHRPIKRRIVGALHEDTMYGCVNAERNLYTVRIEIGKLTAKMLRMPVQEKDERGRTISKDPPLGKGGLVRDRDLRRRLRECILANKLDPDAFLPKQIKALAKGSMLRLPSGVPIRFVKVIRKIYDPVTIKVKGVEKPRVYIAGNNHHMEILQDEKTADWMGICISNLEAARRVRQRQRKGEPQMSMVRKNHGAGKTFILSLAKGETIFSRRQDRPAEPARYYVVSKLNKKVIHFQPVNDARPVKDKKNPANCQDRWSVAPAGLKALGPEPNTPPYKVRVSPLGEVEPLHDD
jgi:CRISPR-associated endonuclease Csn1